MTFSKYIIQFIKNTDEVQTHLSFNRGKYNVPDENYQEFYKNYYEEMKRNVEDLYLIEKVYRSNFAFFIDIDTPKTKRTPLNDQDIKGIINVTNQIIEKVFLIDSPPEYIVSKRGNKYHVNYHGIIVNSPVAKRITTEIKCEIDPTLVDCIDTSVYQTGLRMLGSKKKVFRKMQKKESPRADDGSDQYRIYDLENGRYTELAETRYEDFMKTVIRRVAETPLTAVNELASEFASLKLSGPTGTAGGHKKIPVKGIESKGIAEEVTKLFAELKLTNTALADFDLTVERIYARQNKMGMFCYYVSIRERNCPFKCRQHQRESSPLYIEIAVNGVYVKCHDEDCLRRRYPESGITLPEDLGLNFPKLYLSMSTKYWSTDVTLTDDIKRQLEESLTGSHYQIAKTVYSIYKDRFRVDDVRNTTWYEFDKVRWNKTHLMNILISEELPKYYRGIKISDTSVPHTNLQEYLTNDDKIDANLRNQTVDQIITRLENVTFKNNILNQISYLFKTYDPDFYTNLDANPYLIGFKNGVYDFEKNVFRNAKQGDCLTFSTGYDYIEYDESAPEVQEIYSFLSKIITNTRVREYMLKVLGKSLLGIPDEKFYIWTGLSGANGKSTLVNFLESTLGDYITSVDVSLLTNKRSNSGNASPDIIRLRGKRIFTFQEPEHDDRLRTGILKQYTGGDTIIARELFKAPVTFKLQGTMIMCCNDLPSVASIDGGTWRRIRVIEFKSRFCDNPVKENEFRIDPSLKYKMSGWRPYFMSILIHWYNRYLYEGIDEPEEVKRATAKYKVDNDKFNEFFDQCVEEAPGAGVGASAGGVFESVKTIYNYFQNWWVTNYPTSKIPEHKELRRAMKIKFGNEIERIVNGSVQYGFAVKIKYDMTGDMEGEIERDID